MKKHRLFDVFTGIGGFSLGLKDYSKSVAYCENDPVCVNILNSLMNKGQLRSCKIFHDVADLHMSDIEVLQPTLLSAGFPCQDISVMGPGKGVVNGERSSLINYVFNLIESTPSVQMVFLENSPFIVTRGLDYLLDRLQKLGFTSVWGFFYASDAGALHYRKRWYCLSFKKVQDLPRVGAKTIPRPWKEPAYSRLIQKGNEHINTMKRLSALGNSVVPKCVTVAFEELVRYATLGGVGKITTQQPHIKLTACVNIGNDPPRSWGTPTKTHWTQYSTLKYRMNKTGLANQIFWDNTTWSQFKSRNTRRNMLSKEFDINPHWIEAFMGYPKDWTSF